jgi:hypothetical protein
MREAHGTLKPSPASHIADREPREADVAARKTRQPPAEPFETPQGTGETPPVPVPAEHSAIPPRRLWLWPAVLLFAVWFAFLLTLALFSANPVTLNRRQIRQADLVVEARVENPATGECRIVRTWPEAPQLGPTITIAGLADLAVRPGETYLLPLERLPRGAGFRIAPTPPPLSKPLIYPAADDSRRQLAEILGEQETVEPASDE